MYTIIAFYVIGFVILVYLLRRFIKKEKRDAFVILIPIVGAFVFATIGLIVALSLPVQYETTKWERRLMTLKDNDNIHGKFFLGSGIIEGRMRYVFYAQNADSTYQMWQCDYFDGAIKYSDEQPKVIITDVSPQKSLWNKFAIDAHGDQQTYVFEIPEGSIQNTFELDAQ